MLVYVILNSVIVKIRPIFIYSPLFAGYNAVGYIWKCVQKLAEISHLHSRLKLPNCEVIVHCCNSLKCCFTVSATVLKHLQVSYIMLSVTKPGQTLILGILKVA